LELKTSSLKKGPGLAATGTLARKTTDVFAKKRRMSLTQLKIGFFSAFAILVRRSR
jgi:hypothetical protein